MSCAIERAEMPAWNGKLPNPLAEGERKTALARAQIEEALGLLDGRDGTVNPNRILDAYKALVRARELLVAANAAAALAQAHYAPISAEETEP